MTNTASNTSDAFDNGLETVTRLASPQEQAFARIYALTHSTKRAAQAAGLDLDEATRFLSLASVREQIDYYVELQIQKLDIRTDRILQELAAIGFADPAEFFDDDGDAIPLHQLPPHVRATIKSIDISQTEDLLADGTIRTKKRINIQVWDKLKALDIAAKAKGLYLDNAVPPTPIMDMGKARVVPDSPREPDKPQELEFL